MAGRSLGVILGRAVRLRCPRCGETKLFSSWFKMHERCAECNLKYERAPGYFLGSAYINYGVTAVLLSASYIIFHFVVGVENRILIWPLVAFCLLFPALFFRLARSLWIGIDCFFDPTDFEQDL